MDTFLKICYSMGHETLWDSGKIAKAKASRHSLARIRPQLSFRGRSSKRLFELSGARASGSWLSHGSVDAKTYRGSNRPALWDTLLDRQLLEANDFSRVELPE